MITDIILASASPRREQLLKQIGLVFRIIPGEVAEDTIEAAVPEQYVQKCALAKALASPATSGGLYGKRRVYTGWEVAAGLDKLAEE